MKGGKEEYLRMITEMVAIGRLTKERYPRMATAYESEHQTLSASIAKLGLIVTFGICSVKNHRFMCKQTTLCLLEKKTSGHFYCSTLDSFKFYNIVSKYTDIEELMVDILHELIDYVYNAVGIGKSRTQDVEIYYRFVGLLPDQNLTSQ